MTSPAAEHIETEISGLITSIMAARGSTATLTPEVGLAEIGLTSMDMVNLMLGVEARFNLVIPAEYLTPEHFRSLSAIQAMVERLTRPN